MKERERLKKRNGRRRKEGKGRGGRCGRLPNTSVTVFYVCKREIERKTDRKKERKRERV
jgi:hypothetical protein